MERQPHNNLWAEKLLQVSMPDSAGAWSGMEALLDKEMPRRSWSDWRRWVLLILLLLLLIGVCNCPGRGRLFHGSEISRGSGITRLHAPGGSAASGGPAVLGGPTSAASAGRPAAPSSGPAAPSSGRAAPSGPAAQSPGIRSAPTISTPLASGPATPATPTTPETQASRSDPANHRVRPSGGPLAPVTVKATHRFDDITQTNASARTRRSKKHIVPKRKTGTNTDGNEAPDTDAPTSGAETDAPPSAKSAAPPLAKPNAPEPPTKPATAPPSTKPVAPSLTKPVAPPLAKPAAPKDSTRKNIARKDSTHKKPPPPPKEEDQKEKDHGWVFGVGLNQFFPLGNQRGSTYNSNGLTGTLTDYLPVPMIRYYFNRKTYIQLEAQFNTPQPTAKNLVISQPVPDTSTRSGVFTQVSSSASIQQLYYFNIPLSIHFNPWDNLNIGTGLQWSHLSNAIGEFDSSTSTSVNGNIPNVVDAKSTHSFKGDALYQQIKTNELRFLLDINYTYKHFVPGLRYNQALSKFVNLQLPTGETTQARNSSLQLYLRYILWDTRKKKAPAKTP